VLLVAAVLSLSAYFSRAYWLPAPVDLCFAGDTEVALNETIPYTLGATDVLFAFDQSGSMAGMMDGARADAHRLMTTLAARLGSEHFGVAGFSDYIDFPYRLYQPITGDLDAVQTAINGLELADGGDIPEAYARMMFESYSDPAIGWRPDARRYLVIFGDSYPHDPDAGRDGNLETLDDLILNEVLDKLALEQITLVYVADPGVFSASDLFEDWSVWTDATDGSVIRCAPTESR
jgi:hypothetical protein